MSLSFPCHANQRRLVVPGRSNYRDSDYNFPREVMMDVLCLVSRLSLRCHHTEGRVQTLASGLQVLELLAVESTVLYRSSRATYLISTSSARNGCRSSSVGKISILILSLDRCPTKWGGIPKLCTTVGSRVSPHVVLTSVRIKTCGSPRREWTANFSSLGPGLECSCDPWNPICFICGPSVLEPCFWRYGSRWSPDVVSFVREEV
jgi:hypothetical protein